MSEMSVGNSSEFDRRAMLRMFVGLPVGMAVGAASLPIVAGARLAGERLTGVTMGNASFAAEQEEIQAGCQGSPNPDCAREERTRRDESPYRRFVWPAMEEELCRGVPAVISDIVDVHQQDPRPSKDEVYEVVKRRLFTGTPQPLTSRRELIAGASSSLAFGAFHNLTNRGLNTRTFPLQQILFGAGCWILQRRFGIFSNVAAHITANEVIRRFGE